MRTIVFDKETTNLLNSVSIDYSVMPYRLKEDFKIHCIGVIDINSREVFGFHEGSKLFIPGMDYIHKPLSEFRHFLKEVGTVIGHNIIDFDLLVAKLFLGIDYTVYPDTVDGRDVEIIDTLILSKTLNPDRWYGHSLEAWGRQLNFHKGDYGKEPDAWDVFTPAMLAYCIRDCELNVRVYLALEEEWGDWDWNEAYQLEKAVAEIITRQSHYGFKYDDVLARWCFTDLSEKLSEIELAVEPLLPKRPIGKTLAKDYIPPKNQFIGSGEGSSYLYKFLERHNGKVIEKDLVEVGKRVIKTIEIPRKVEIYGKEFTLPLPADEPIVTEEPMLLSHQEHIKKYLITLGWEPTNWKDKDLTLDSKKRKLTKEKYIEAVERYIENTIDTPYESFRASHLQLPPKFLRERLLRRDISRPVKVLSTPSFTKNQEKELCDSLVSLGQKVAFVSDIVSWLTYRHRRNSILSLALESKTKKTDTGWLANPRLAVDGRINTPADTCGCNTSRFQHRDVTNIPRNTSLYGENMRSQFGVDEGDLQIGYDADGLEARIEAHRCWAYDDKDHSYSTMLVAKKPHDLHTVRAETKGISRDDSKTMKYSLTYGATAGKVAKQFGWSKEQAEYEVESFWEDAIPLAKCKKKLENAWEFRYNKQFVLGIDGRKIMTRSKHALLNADFQSAGVICMKRAMVILDRDLAKEGLLGNPFNEDIKARPTTTQMIAYHDEAQNRVDKRLVKFKVFDVEDDAKAYKLEAERKDRNLRLSDVGESNGKHFVAYSRVGELSVKSVEKAGEYYNLNIPLTAGYAVGKNWRDCH